MQSRGRKCTKKASTGGHFEKSTFVKIPQGLESGTQRIWIQHLKIITEPSKNIVYAEMQDLVDLPSDYSLKYA